MAGGPGTAGEQEIRCSQGLAGAALTVGVACSRGGV